MSKEVKTTPEDSLKGTLACALATIPAVGQAYFTNDYLQKAPRRITLLNEFRVVNQTSDVSQKSTLQPTITDDAQKILDSHSELNGALAVALNSIGKYVGSDFKTTVERFVDPYDGVPSLVVSLTSSKTHRQVSKGIDEFCTAIWYEYMDKTPVDIIFQAGD